MRAMTGSATFTTLPSSAAMKTAREAPMSAHQRQRYSRESTMGFEMLYETPFGMKSFSSLLREAIYLDFEVKVKKKVSRVLGIRGRGIDCRVRGISAPVRGICAFLRSTFEGAA